jgi:hypothetical protein
MPPLPIPETLAVGTALASPVPTLPPLPLALAWATAELPIAATLETVAVAPTVLELRAAAAATRPAAALLLNVSYADDVRRTTLGVTSRITTSSSSLSSSSSLPPIVARLCAAPSRGKAALALAAVFSMDVIDADAAGASPISELLDTEPPLPESERRVSSMTASLLTVGTKVANDDVVDDADAGGDDLEDDRADEDGAARDLDALAAAAGESAFAPTLFGRAIGCSATAGLERAVGLLLASADLRGCARVAGASTISISDASSADDDDESATSESALSSSSSSSSLSSSLSSTSSELLSSPDESDSITFLPLPRVGAAVDAFDFAFAAVVGLELVDFAAMETEVDFATDAAGGAGLKVDFSDDDDADGSLDADNENVFAEEDEATAAGRGGCVLSRLESGTSATLSSPSASSSSSNSIFEPALPLGSVSEMDDKVDTADAAAAGGASSFRVGDLNLDTMVPGLLIKDDVDDGEDEALAGGSSNPPMNLRRNGLAPFLPPARTHDNHRF